MRRVPLLIACAVVLVASLGCTGAAERPAPTGPNSATTAEPEKPKRPDGVVGYYVHDDPAFYMVETMDKVPPGQVMYLGIEEGRWMMRNMLTAHGGTWSVTEEGATLTVNEGPTGKADGKEVLLAVRTEQGVTLSLSASNEQSLRFKYVGESAPADFGYEEFLGQQD